MSFSKHSAWVSPELMVQKNRSFSELRAEQGWVLWLERRPEEAGRTVIVARSPDGAIHEITSKESDVGTRVHVYGGGAWAYRVTTQGIDVVYSDQRNGGVWLKRAGQESPVLIGREVEAGQQYYYADFSFSSDGKDVFCVRETHDEGQEIEHIVSLSEEGCVTVWEGDADFYASPRLSPDGRWLAWIEWNNPEMPWTATHLCVRPRALVSSRTVLEGQNGSCSVMEPFWEGTRLYALSDRPIEGYERAWTPIGFEQDGAQWRDIKIPHAGKEVGLPAWVFGQRSCVPLGEGALLARGVYEGFGSICHYDPHEGWCDLAWGGTPENVPFPIRNNANDFAWINTPPDAPPSIMVGKIGEDGQSIRTAWSLPEGVEKADIAVPRVIRCEVPEGVGPLRALFYEPARGARCVPSGSKPPLVVIVHGGPTGQSRTDLSFKVQWWTSRGFAVLDVNYRGSTGCGRAYREALNGLWGVRDVQDCCTAVETVIAQGLVDPKRCVIRGSSAGGLTVLSALAQSDFFVAGTSLYGVTDLRGLVAETHRFEARYLDGLVAPWPEGEAVYIERSPLSWPERIKAPVLFLHGDADPVVPLSQAQALSAQLQASTLHIYPREGHGFRHPDVIVDSLQRELAFYQRVFASVE